MTGQHELQVQNPVILVVEDDPAVRSSLKFSLEIDGFAVRVYPSGGELLSDANLPTSGCLVIDYNLSRTNGLELLGKLRERRVSMPAILITSHPNLTLRERAAAAGALVVEKPLLGNALVDGIRDAVAKRLHGPHG
jgi:FixJ family two-component response regulator